MTSRDFCYWLQGFCELADNEGLTEKQLDTVKKHLNMVFIHEIDPSMPDPDGKLQAAHEGKPAALKPQPQAPWHKEPLARC